MTMDPNCNALDCSEVLYRSGVVEMTRKDFWDIRPGFKISGEVVLNHILLFMQPLFETILLIIKGLQ